MNEANFKDPNGAHEYITLINNIRDSLSSFQAKLKSEVAREKNEKDSLNRDAETERYNR